MALPAEQLETEKAYPKKELSLRRREIVSSIRWAWFNDIGYYPHRFQIAMHDSPARYRTSCAGRRGGKSEWAGREASAYMMAGPYRVWIIAPSYDLGEREFRVIEKSLDHPANHYKIVRRLSNRQAGTMYLLLSNGAECEVKSIDKPQKSAHGEEIDLIILSEAGIMDNIGGEDGVWNKTLVGAMATRLADVIIPTTPCGQDDFLYPIFMKGLIPDSPHSQYEIFKDEYIDLRAYYKAQEEYDSDYFSLQWPAWANADGYLEDAAKQYRDLPLRIFMEQVAGFFVKWSGSIWLNDFCYDPEVHLVEPFNIKSWWNRIEIIDPGFSGMFAWIAAVIDDSSTIYIVDEYSAKRTLYRDHVVEIKRRRAQFHDQFSNGRVPNFIPVYVDPEDPQCRAELNNEGLQCIAADNDVTGGFQAGGIRFKAKKLFIFSTLAKLDRSLRNHEWAKSRAEGGKIKEANDTWKHFSDLIRYLNLASIWSSEEPVVIEARETVRDMIEAARNDPQSVLDLTMDQWERRHVA